MSVYMIVNGLKIVENKILLLEDEPMSATGQF